MTDFKESYLPEDQSNVIQQYIIKSSKSSTLICTHHQPKFTKKIDGLPHLQHACFGLHTLMHTHIMSHIDMYTSTEIHQKIGGLPHLQHACFGVHTLTHTHIKSHIDMYTSTDVSYIRS